MSDINNLFLKTAQAHRPMAAPAQAVAAVLSDGATLSSSAAAAVVTTESRSQLTHSDQNAMVSMHQSFVNMFTDLHDQLSSIKRMDSNGQVQVTTEALEQRATIGFTGALMASDAKLGALQSQKLQKPSTGNVNDMPMVTVEAYGTGYHDKRSIYTAEAFQNYDLQNSRIFSALFNYSIVDFDEFTRTFWRPVTISPDSSFVELLVNVLTVFNGYEHTNDGKAKDWRRHNLVRAIADHTILHTDLTKAIPNKNTANSEYFMTKVAEKSITQADKTVVTAPLLAGVTDVDYIGLAMPDWLVKSGTLDQRDNLDPGVKLDKLYLALADDVIEFDVKGMPGTEFNAAPQGDRQKETLTWTTSALVVNKNTKNIDNGPLVNLAPVVTGEMTLKVRIDIQAEINLETGELVFNAGKPVIRSLLDKDGNIVASTDARYTEVATALKGVTEVGYTLDAYRSNAARRQRGQLINIRQFAENVTVPWRDPIAAERPAHASGEQDTSDLTALMSGVRVRVMNEGVTALFDAEAVLARTAVDENYDSASVPSTLGVGRHYVLPYYSHEELDMVKMVDSIKSGDRNADIQASLVGTLRNRLAHAYTDSQYKAASDALSGGTAPKPKVALVTDPVIARYLLEPGELRTMVDFELVVVPILDFRMRGQVKMVFITDDGGNDVNYLNFGYLFWSPEHVLVANMTRTGGYNRETQVQPRYRHYVACPVMMSFTVKGIEEVLKKVTLNVEDQKEDQGGQVTP